MLPTSKWQQPFDAALTDVFQVQSDIATRVAQALGVALGANEEKRLSERPTQNLAAYDAFLKGEEAWKVGEDPPSLRKALGYYEQAVALDPGFALAWTRVSRGQLASLREQHAHAGAGGARPAGGGERRLPSPRPPRGDTWHSVTISGWSSGTSAVPWSKYAKGLRVAPGNVDLLSATAQAEEALGRWEAAVEHLRQAKRLDPRSVNTHQTLGDALLCLRRYSEARGAYDRGLALAPANLGLIEFKAMTFLGEGDLAGARAVLQTALKDVEPTELAAFVAGYNDPSGFSTRGSESSFCV